MKNNRRELTINIYWDDSEKCFVGSCPELNLNITNNDSSDEMEFLKEISDYIYESNQVYAGIS